MSELFSVYKTGHILAVKGMITNRDVTSHAPPILTCPVINVCSLFVLCLFSISYNPLHNCLSEKNMHIQHTLYHAQTSMY